MKKYLLVFKTTLQQISNYRFNFFIHVIKYGFSVSLMALVWLAIQKEADVSGLTPESTVSYFFFAAILYGLSNFHTWYVEEDIKLGYLSKYLTKPYNYFWSGFATQITYSSLETIIKMFVMVPLLFILGFNFYPQLWQVIGFLLYLPLIFVFAFITQFTVASLSFWVTDSYSLRWVSLNIVRFLSGIIIPLHLLPEKFLQISKYLPFQYLAYTPINLIQAQVSLQEAITGWLILLSWTVLAWILKNHVWQKGSHSYEATGI